MVFHTQQITRFGLPLHTPLYCSTQALFDGFLSHSRSQLKQMLAPIFIKEVSWSSEFPPPLWTILSCSSILWFAPDLTLSLKLDYHSQPCPETFKLVVWKKYLLSDLSSDNRRGLCYFLLLVYG